MDDSVPIHRLIRRGASVEEIERDIDENGSVNTRAPSGKSPLMTAAYLCRKDVMALLLNRGAVCTALDTYTGDTPAHFLTLSLCGHVRQSACLMLLIEYGADISARNNDGYTVFELAEKNGNHDIGSTGDAMTSDR